jgi:AcrR family transcriptional regulator
LASRGDREQVQGEERSKRQERADRILDAALELFSRWGYKKTTVDDIARQAGVAKGTIYLHWKTREALFEALLLRESLSTILEFRQRMDNDPAGARFSVLTRNVVFIVLNNPLFRAMLLRDTERLGDLTRLSRGQHVMQFRMEMAITYLELLRKNGMLRTDMNLDRQLKMMAAIYMGFFAADQYLPPNLHFLPGEMAETLAETVHRTFEPEEPPAPEALKEVTQALNRLLDQLTDVIESTYKDIEGYN